MTLEEQIKVLFSETQKLRQKVVVLEKHKLEQDKIIQIQGIRIAELEEELRKARLSKNSNNSSKPPSTDIVNHKKRQSLREPSEKRTGGQPGHKGTTLKMTDNPDIIIDLSPNYCNDCGCCLESTEAHLEAKRQEVDIPPIHTIIKEYRQYSKECPQCGHHQRSSFPKHISNNIQYGPNVTSLISYFSVYQYIPFRRLKELFSHIFNLDLSEGTIDNILKRMSIKAQPYYDKIRELILQLKQAGSDETSVIINGIKFWIWVWQSKFLTYLTLSESRGMKAIDSVFPDGLEKAILNTDRWAAQLKTKAAGHQLCVPHLLRELKFIEEVDKIDWATRFKEFLKKGLELKKQQLEYSRDNPILIQLEEELDKLLQENIPKDIYRNTYKFQKSLKKNRDSILTFLYHKEVPADNNGSERAIRNVKVKQKISGQFKTGGQIFCVLRSIIDTCKKNDNDVMKALNLIAQV
ncbi:MAG: IS66 family transposase [Flavobacterium sp.]|nr:IS66 family transposase [Flavobacterium sp.]